MTPWFLHTLRSDLRRHLVAERLVWSLGVVVAYPTPDHFPCMADRLKVMMPYTFFLHSADEPLDHAILFRAVRRDELLGQSISPDHKP